MSKYKVDDKVWVMFNNGEKIGSVPAEGIVEAQVIGDKLAFGTKEYSVLVAPYIIEIMHNFYNEYQMFPTEKALFDHLKKNRIDR